MGGSFGTPREIRSRATLRGMNFMLNVGQRPPVVAIRTPLALRRTEADGWTASALIEIVRRRIGLVAKVVAVFVAAALLYVIFAVPRFTATTSLIPDMKRAPPAPNEVSQETLVDPAIVENQVETIRSSRIALTVIDRLGLSTDEEFVGKEPGRLVEVLTSLKLLAPLEPPANDPTDEEFRKEPGWLVQALTTLKLLAPTEPATNERKRHVAAEIFARMLKVVRVGRSYLTEISFTSTDPAKAAAIANAIADTYIQDQLGAQFANAERSSRWMQERIVELDRQAAGAAQAIENYKSSHNLELDTNGKSVALRQYEELFDSLGQAKAETERINALVQRAQSALQAQDLDALPDSGFLDSGSDKTVRRLRDQYRETQRELSPTSLQDRDGQPDDPEHAARLAQLRGAIWNAVDAGIKAAQKKLEVAMRDELQRIKEIAPVLEAKRKEMDELAALDRKYQSYRQRHEALQNRYARVAQFVQQQSLPVSEARIIAEATPPLTQSSPKRTLIVLLAAVAGGLVGVGSAFAREYFDRTVRRPKQLEQDLGIRSLGAVQRFGSRMRPVHATSAEGSGDQRNGNAGSSGSFLARRIDYWLSGTAGETLRAVKVALDDNVHSRGRVLAVVSPNSGEGKTTIALALAILTARAGKRTCLIDADIREPSLTRALTPGATGGLVAAVGQRVSFADSVLPHEFGFHFLGQEPGFTGSHPSDILGSDAMQDMLEHLRSRHDYVIVDTPALLPYVDVGAAAGLFDAFLLIAEWGRTTIDDIDQSLASSNTLAERLVGALINKNVPKTRLRSAWRSAGKRSRKPWHS
jgi:uncharacterized protein involved in exopolysaccharide biosynthesis/Mrp family chromosome partitioning ATPase